MNHRLEVPKAQRKGLRVKIRKEEALSCIIMRLKERIMTNGSLKIGRAHV